MWTMGQALGVFFSSVLFLLVLQDQCPERAGFHFLMLPCLWVQAGVWNYFTALQGFVRCRWWWILACRLYHWGTVGKRKRAEFSRQPVLRFLTHKCSNHQQHFAGGSAFPWLCAGMGEPGGLLFFPALFFLGFGQKMRFVWCTCAMFTV